MVNLNKNIGSFIAVINPNDKLLLLKKNYGNNFWTLPGGRVEKDESLLESLEREMKEETGNDFTIFNEVPTLNSIHFIRRELSIAFIFKGYADSSKIKVILNSVSSGDDTVSEHSDFEWFTYEDALNLDISEYTKNKINTIYRPHELLQEY